MPHEARFAARDFWEVRRLRISVMFVLPVFLLVFGMTVPAIELAIILAAYEVVSEVFSKRILASSGKDPTTERVFFLLSIVGLNLLMIYPIMALMQQSSLPLFVIAALWLLGLLMFIVNNFNRLPFIVSLTVTGMGAIALSALYTVMNGAPLGQGTVLERNTAYVVLAIYVGYCFVMLERQNRANAALEKARVAAADRLVEIEYRMRHDHLTGLLNRRTFDAELARWLAAAAPDDVFWLTILDVNDFKLLNETIGTDAGDAVLIAVADRIRESVQGQALFGRVDGDEFVIALKLDGPEADPKRWLHELDRAISQPLDWKERVLDVSVSMGLTASRKPPRSVSVLSSQADRAMHHAQRTPNGAGVVYSPLMGDLASAEEDRACLRTAIQSNAITPFYQPKVCLRSGRVIGFEALARWHHPNGTIVPPGRFLPWVRNSGLDDMLGEHIARRVCARMIAWDREGFGPLDMAVNASESTLVTHSGRAALVSCVESVAPLLDKGWSFTVEITEDVFFARSGSMITGTLHALRAAGARIALDDFGTGYASLQHLNELRIDEIKIDRSFTQALDSSTRAESLVKFTIDVAEALGLSVVVEGVETTAQRDKLLGHRAKVGQGYLWSAAVPSGEARGLLVASRDGDGVQTTEAMARGSLSPR